MDQTEAEVVGDLSLIVVVKTLNAGPLLSWMFVQGGGGGTVQWVFVGILGQSSCAPSRSYICYRIRSLVHVLSVIYVNASTTVSFSLLQLLSQSIS